MIPIPPEFKELCLQFQLASLSYFGSPERMIASTLTKFGDQKRKVIKEFLSDLLSAKYDKEEISDVWHSTGSDFFFSNNEQLTSHQQLTSFLRLIQERVSRCAMQAAPYNASSTAFATSTVPLLPPNSIGLMPSA
jgi:hypothetical protein